MESQRKTVSLNTTQGKQELLKFCKSFSEPCYQFLRGFLQLLNIPESEANSLSSKYSSLISTHFKHNRVKTPSPICAKLLPQQSFAFKCYDCQLQDNSIICIECFNKSKHEGHNYQKIAVAGGCCDCGDDEKWNEIGSCIDHQKKQDDIQIDQQQTKRFIKQMQFILYLEFVLSLSTHPSRRFHQRCIQQSFMRFLTSYNESSMISNQQTFHLLKSRFIPTFPDVIYGQKKLTLRNLTVFNYFMRLYKEKQFSKMAVNLFIMMFTRSEFKKYLTINYNKEVTKKPQIQLSQISGISCQIFTSHKMINQLLDSGQFLPLELKQISNQTKFESIAQIYSRYYIDLKYLSHLYNGVGAKYIKYHLNKGNITTVSGYQQYVRDGKECIQYYGIQKIMFNYLFQILKLVKSDKQTLIKSIKDIVQYLSLAESDQPISLYIPKQRTLMILLFLYFEGDAEKAIDSQFLKSVQLSKRVIYRILQAVMYVIRFYAVVLANRQTVERFYTFYSFCLYKKPRSIVSLDFELVKFCIGALSLYSTLQFEFYDEQGDLKYQSQMVFQQNRMPLQHLICLPSKFIQKQLMKEAVNNQESAYDRRKALGVFTDYLGLLHQILITNHSQLNIKNNLQYNKEQQVIYFYGQLLKSLDSIKFQDFKLACTIFFKEQVPLLSRFVKQFCVIQNKIIKLNSSKQNLFEPINLTYLKSKKSLQFLQTLISANKQKYGLSFLPKSSLPEKWFEKIKDALFNQILLDEIMRITIDYLSFFKQHPQLIQIDIFQFSLYIEQIVKIHHTIKYKGFQQILRVVRQHQNILNCLPEWLKKQILSLIGNLQDSNEQQKLTIIKQGDKKQIQKKAKMKQMKSKKLQKFKSKQQKAINFHQEDNIQMDSEQQFCCMFCKLGDEEEDLSILCFKQKSNLFSKKYLGIQRSVQFITTCGHFAHQSCHKNVNKDKQYTFCNFCKTSSNLLLTANSERRISVDLQSMDFSEQLEPELKRKTKSLSQKPNLLFSLEEMEQINSANQQYVLTEKQKVVQQIACFVLYGSIIDYQFFIRSQAKICCYLLSSLAYSKKATIENLLKQIDQQFSGPQIDQKKNIFRGAYRFAILSVASVLGIQRDPENKNWDIRILQQSLPQELTQNIVHIITSIGQPKSLKFLSETKLIPFCPPQFRALPFSLQDLCKQIGTCPRCSRITNEIGLCLLCDFKSCVGCETQNLVWHSQKCHAQASIFIRVDEGYPLYVSPRKNRQIHSLYMNFMGETFILDNSFKKIKQRSQYKLDTASYNKIKNDIIRHRIQQQVRYIELVTSKESIINP